MRGKSFVRALQKRMVVLTVGCGILFQFGGSCNLGEFTTTTTTTLSGRGVVSFLLRPWILSPLEQAVNNGINGFFDRLDDNNT